MNQINISNTSLLLSFALVIIAMFVSYREKLGIGKEILIAVFRSSIQLLIVGYILKFIFKLDNFYITIASIIIIVVNAAFSTNTRNKALKIPHTFVISLVSIFVGTAITLAILLSSGSLKFVPSQVIPFSGMIASNIMSAIVLCFNNLANQFQDTPQTINEKLALGATPHQASMKILRDSIKTAMIPTLNGAKTNGIVSLPGMMSGLILAGVDPVIAIKYQVVVTFMIVGATAVSSVIASFLAYQQFFNKHEQLVN